MSKRSTKERDALAYQRQVGNRDPRIVPPPTFTNTSQRETYTPPTWFVREGGEQHRQFRSRG